MELDNAKEFSQLMVELQRKLFKQLDRLDNDDLKGEALEAEIERSKAVALCANQILGGMNTVIKTEMLKRNIAGSLTYKGDE